MNRVEILLLLLSLRYTVLAVGETPSSYCTLTPTKNGPGVLPPIVGCSESV